MSVVPFRDDDSPASVVRTSTEVGREVPDWQATARALEAENAALKERIRKLERLAPAQEKPLQRDGVYWLKLSKDDRDTGPYCRRCYDAADKFERLEPSRIGARVSWRCPTCWTSYRR